MKDAAAEIQTSIIALRVIDSQPANSRVFNGWTSQMDHGNLSKRPLSHRRRAGVRDRQSDRDTTQSHSSFNRGYLMKSID